MRLVELCVVLVCASAPLSSDAQIAIVRYQFDLPRGPLDLALREFAHQTGLQIARLSDTSSSDTEVGPVSGSLTSEEALRGLLADSGLTYRVLNERTIAIVKQPGPSDFGAPASSVTKATNKWSVAEIAIHLDQVVVRASKPLQLREVIATGSHIAEAAGQRKQPLSVINTQAIERTGLADVGALLQQLTISGSALNAKFNSAGNFAYPPDGGGIGAGSAQVNLRNLDSKRVLVLVDGMRWVNESSASGLSGSADLTTIPLSVIDHMEILEDGASSIYGSDAIAGVVNIITRKEADEIEVTGYTGNYGKGGHTTEGSVTVGGSSDHFAGMFVASYFKQNAVSSSKWWQSEFPEPFAGKAAGSSATPQGRASFCDPRVPVPNYGSCTPDQGNFYDLTLNNGTTTPVWDPAAPTSGTYHNWSNADRFNFAPFNLLLAPSERKSIFTNFTYTINDHVEAYLKGLYNTRDSASQAAPEPIFVGPYAGTGGLADTLSISAKNPYNPFGIDLNAASNLGWVTRRPLEAGPRVFTQNVNT
jgi:iron complex outermembrane recepter protein